MAIVHVAILGLGLAGLPAVTVCADGATIQASTGQPWISDQQLLVDAWAATGRDDIKAIAPYVPDLEKALARAKHAYDLAKHGSGDNSYQLIEGGWVWVTPIEQSTGVATPSKSSHKIVPASNPYPMTSVVLASYYNAVGRPRDALRVIGMGLALPDINESLNRLSLVVERGDALTALKLWREALASYSEDPRSPNVDVVAEAKMYLGRGNVLIKLKRLDDAEASFKRSLELDPDNERALEELAYIAKLNREAASTPLSAISPLPTP